MRQNSTQVHCPVKLNCNPLQSLLYLACRAFIGRVDLNLKSNIKIFTGEHLKTTSGIPYQINNSKGWYQNVLFGGSVLNPRYKSLLSSTQYEKPISRILIVPLKEDTADTLKQRSACFP